MSGVPDPLDNLVDRVKDDVTAAYQDDVITAMVELRRDAPGAYVVLYNSLKKECPDFVAGEFNRLIDREWAKTSPTMAGDPDDTATILAKHI